MFTRNTNDKPGISQVTPSFGGLTKLGLERPQVKQSFEHCKNLHNELSFAY